MSKASVIASIYLTAFYVPRVIKNLPCWVPEVSAILAIVGTTKDFNGNLFGILVRWISRYKLDLIRQKVHSHDGVVLTCTEMQMTASKATIKAVCIVRNRCLFQQRYFDLYFSSYWCNNHSAKQ